MAIVTAARVVIRPNRGKGRYRRMELSGPRAEVERRGSGLGRRRRFSGGGSQIDRSSVCGESPGGSMGGRGSSARIRGVTPSAPLCAAAG